MSASKQRAKVSVRTGLGAAGEVALVDVAGVLDETFDGFGDLGGARVVLLQVGDLTRISSPGVRQWKVAVDALPKGIDAYLVGCPTFFVDQLNMVLRFGGPCKVLSVAAPFTCVQCAAETSELIDLLGEHTALVQGTLRSRACSKCGGKLELDETADTYFAFANTYAPSKVNPAAAEVLASEGLYTATELGDPSDKPPKIIKLVHGSVTYFRLIGQIGASFRARPILQGPEGEVALDVAEIERFTPGARTEWTRLLKELSGQVPSVALIDVNASFLSTLGDTVALARNIAVISVLVSRRCSECGRTSNESVNLTDASWPLTFPPGVCAMCGGVTRDEIDPSSLAPLQKASTRAPKESVKVYAQRAEILSRAVTEANVARAGDGAAAAITADDIILGKYRIVQRLSAGGMAEVFLATQVGLGGFEKAVALKRIQRRLLESRKMAVDMFLNEAKIVGRLTHPNIVQVLDVGEAQGALYLAMEYVHGKDVRALVKTLRQRKESLPLGEILFIAREVAQALHYAYWSVGADGERLKVVHRDVSPHNVIIGFDGGVKLIDFGVAVSSVTEQASSVVVGKWQYMAPEATRNEAVDHRSDLFSLGVVLYHLCSGEVPFSDRSPKEIVRKIRAGEYKRLQERVPVPDALAALVDRMLAPSPEDRPQRGQDVVAALDEIARAEAVDASGIWLSRRMKELYPDDVSNSARPLEIHDIESSAPHTSVTPRSLSKVDMSISFHGRPSHSISIPSAMVMGKEASAPVQMPREAVAARRSIVPKAILVGVLVVLVAVAVFVIVYRS